ncbi:MAG: hypothetical protein IKP88_19520 [Lachnospiraceae bacterium]|nr:hypothetical protein [Lachnospiraceae bacterium]
MKRYLKYLLLLTVCIAVLAGCTEKSKQDADKLTSDIVDYSQSKVDEATESLSQGIQEYYDSTKEYIEEQAGDFSEKLVDGLRDAAIDVKNEAEDLAGAVKDDLTNNISQVVEDVKDSLSGKDPTPTPVVIDETPTPEPTATDDNSDSKYVEYRFRSKKLLDQHFEKHGKEMGFSSSQEYEKAASDVINNPKALSKIEKEDGDFVYYVEETNEFVILSTDGYIRTYFLPSQGKKYYDRQ